MIAPTCKYSIYDPRGLTQACALPLYHSGPHKPERSARGLDLFCGAGGAGMGYSRLGFEMVGVDIANQPRYPFTFIRAAALSFLAAPWVDLSAFSFIHASPPCQHYSDLAGRNGNADAYPALIGIVREVLDEIGLPYVIENVEGQVADLCRNADPLQSGATDGREEGHGRYEESARGPSDPGGAGRDEAGASEAGRSNGGVEARGEARPRPPKQPLGICPGGERP